MNIIKKIIALLIALCFIFCAVGCEEKYAPYDNFEPAGVLIIDCINGNEYEMNIDDAKFAEKMLNEFKKLDIDTDTEGEVGSSYLYMRFYDESKSTLLIFTIYENGSCCLGEEYEEYYKVINGRQAYIDLVELYESYNG